MTAKKSKVLASASAWCGAASLAANWVTATLLVAVTGNLIVQGHDGLALTLGFSGAAVLWAGLFGPLLFPIARQLGIHEVHYAMVVVLSMGLGLFAPPLGVGYYAACAIGRVPPDEGIRPIFGYMVALFIGTVVVAAVPWISIGFL